MRTVRFNTVIAALAALMIMSGCGYNPEKPVYNTADNPKDFPRLAVDVLDRLEKGHLSDLESVSDAFAEIYVSHPELLDNKDWQEIVDRLGARFKFLAEKVLSSETFGIDDYTQLADYYTLASFARPADSVLAKWANEFSCWRDVVDAFPRLKNAVGRTTMENKDKIEIVKFLAFHPDPCVGFLREHVANVLFEVKPSASQLTTAQVALLDFAGVAFDKSYEPMATFSYPRIDLVALEMLPRDSGGYDVEIYFVPYDTVVEDLRIAFWINVPDKSPDDQIGVDRFPFDFDPVQSSSAWAIGRAAAAHQTVDYTGPVGTITIGLYKSFGSRMEFLPVKGTDSNFVTLPAPQR